MQNKLRVFVASLLLFLPPLILRADTAQDYRGMGQALFQKGLYAKSVEYFKQAVQADPNDWQSYQGMGDAYLKMNDNVEALNAYNKSLAINPNNPTVQTQVQNLGGTTGATGNPSVSTSPSTNNPPGNFDESQPITETQTVVIKRLHPYRRPELVVNYNDGLAPMDHAKIWTQFSFGYSYSKSGDLLTSANSWNSDISSNGWTGSAIGSTDGLNLGFELGFLLNPNSGLALGVKYINISDYKLNVNFQDGPVTDTGTGDIYDSDYDQTTLSPYIVPITLDYYLFLPDSGGRFWISGGVGYYFGDVHVDRNYQSSTVSGGNTSVNTDNYSGDLNAGALGFQVGIGRDFAITPKFGISLYARGRYAKLTNFTGTVTDSGGNIANVGLATEPSYNNEVFVEDTTQIGGAGNHYATVDFTGFDAGVALNFYSF